MYKKRTIIFIAVLITLGLLALVLERARVTATLQLGPQTRDIKVNLSPSKASLVQGEVMVLNAEITNNGDADVALAGVSAESGYLKLFVAGEDQKFREYSKPRVGVKASGTTIKPGQTIKSQATLLWNASPAKRFVNPKEFEQSHIMTDLVFPEPGIYFVKAVLGVPRVDGPLTFESEPIQVVINEATGDDRPVWEKIKTNPDIAYFIQQESPLTANPDERAKLLDEVEQIAGNSQNSYLARQAKQSLERFRENEVKRKEWMEKLKKQQSLQD